jgi:hypothetical protein
VPGEPSDVASRATLENDVPRCPGEGRLLGVAFRCGRKNFGNERGPAEKALG